MKEQIFATIKKYETIIIHRHVRPDPDAYGSQGGLAELIKASFPDKNVYVVGEEEPSLKFLNEMDQVPDQAYDGALVIVCDTANQERVSDARFNKGDMLIKIDHHPNDDRYGDIVWVDTNASSVSEMIYEFYLAFKEELQLTTEAATLIYAGIVGDTGRFLYPSTNVKTFQYASELIQCNVNLQGLYQKLYETKETIAKLTGYVLNSFERTAKGVAYIRLTKELLNTYDVTPNESSQIVGVLGNIKDIAVWVFFVEEDDQIRVRLRSNGPIINTIAQKYNGGGHPLAAGASIYKWEDVTVVIADLDAACATHATLS